MTKRAPRSIASSADDPRRIARPEHSRLGLEQDRRRAPVPSKLGKSRAPSSGASRSTAMPCSLRTRSLSSPQPCSPREEPGDAASGRRARFPSRARARARGRARGGAERVYQALSPCEKRISRDSPPEAARTWPGGYCSTSGDVPAARDEPERERAAEDPGADDDRARQSGSASRTPLSRRHAASSRVSVRRISQGRDAQRPARSRSARDGFGGELGCEWKTASS